MNSTTLETISEITMTADLAQLQKVKQELMMFQRRSESEHTKAILSANIQDIDNSAVLIV